MVAFTTYESQVASPTSSPQPPPSTVTVTASTVTELTMGQGSPDEKSSNWRAPSSDSPSPAPTPTPAPAPASALASDPSSPLTTITTTHDGVDYHEGSPIAWRVVFGSWLALFGSLGLLNSIGAFHSYIERHQLHSYDPAAVSWVFGIYCGLTFFCGVQVAPLFEAYGPRGLIAAGGAGTVAMLLLLGICTKLWHFILVFGVLGGISVAMVFGPTVAIVAHYFHRRRGLATGTAMSGASAGGIVFPLMLHRLYPVVGFAWATRVAALMCFCTFSGAVLLIRRRFPRKPLSMSTVLPNLAAFKDLPLTLTALGVFFMEWGLFVPLSYLPSYSLDQGLSWSFSYTLLALINAGAVPGRLLPGFLSDKFGRFNVLIVTILLCGVSVASLWLPSDNSAPMLAAFAVTFGFFSGSNLSLAPVCIGQLCSIENYGRYYATANVLVSISTLTSIPIGGEIASRSNGNVKMLIAFTICSYVASFICLVLAKIACCGWRGLLAVF